jgi:hypothetical protein
MLRSRRLHETELRSGCREQGFVACGDVIGETVEVVLETGALLGLLLLQLPRQRLEDAGREVAKARQGVLKDLLVSIATLRGTFARPVVAVLVLVLDRGWSLGGGSTACLGHVSHGLLCM